MFLVQLPFGGFEVAGPGGVRVGVALVRAGQHLCHPGQLLPAQVGQGAGVQRLVGLQACPLLGGGELLAQPGCLDLGCCDLAGGFGVGEAHEVVEHVGRHAEVRAEFGMALVCDIEAVQAVEPDKSIVRGQQEILPGHVGFGGRVGFGGFQQDDPWPVGCEIRPFQHGPLGALDIDLQEVDGSAHVLPADLRKRFHHDRDGAHGPSVRAVPFRQAAVQRGQPRAFDDLQDSGAGLRAKRDGQRRVAPACRLQPARIGRHRLDVDAGPAPFIERAGDGVVVGMLGAGVDVEPCPDMPQRTPQHHVLEVLGVGYEGHASFLPLLSREDGREVVTTALLRRVGSTAGGDARRAGP